VLEVAVEAEDAEVSEAAAEWEVISLGQGRAGNVYALIAALLFPTMLEHHAIL
jgi:hypothetical protein